MRYDLSEMDRLVSPERFPAPGAHSSDGSPSGSAFKTSTVTLKLPPATLASLGQPPPDMPPTDQTCFSPDSPQPSQAVPVSPSNTNDGANPASHLQGADQFIKPSVEQPSELPSPSVASSTVDRPGSQAGSSNKLRPSVTFKYRVLPALTPRRVAQRWSPRGRFQDKTLAELIKELPFDDAELRGLTFTIECEIMSTVEHILSDDENGFTSMKQYISMEIRKWLMDQQSLVGVKAPSLVVDMLIEQMGQEDKQQRVEGLGNLELEW
jgi:hypothetical protein